MAGEFKEISARRYLFGLLIIAAMLRFWVAWQPVEVLVTKNLPDDAFYYFVIARNLVNLGSPSLDGQSITNGFHPLWFVLILPIFAWTRVGAELPIHITLSLASLLDVGSVFLLARLAAILLRDWRAGLVAGWIYSINPVVILQATNGLETSLGIFTALLFLSTFHAWLTQHLGEKLTMLAGFGGGLMFLARTDSIFLFAASMIAALWYWNKTKRIYSVFRAAIAALITVSPWLAWNQLNLGKIFQDSGEAVPYVIHQKFSAEWGPGLGAFLAQSTRQLFDLTVWLRGDFTGLPLFIGIVFWLIALILLIRRWSIIPNRLEIAILLPILVASVLLILAHAGFRWYPRPWYFVPSSVGFALCFAISTHNYLREKRYVVPLVAFLSAVFLLTGQIFWNVGYYPWQRIMLQASQWLSHTLGKGETAAAFNAGILAYYNSPKVVNLDGVVNHQAYKAIQARALIDYAKTRKVDYLIEADYFVWEQFAPFMGEGFPGLLEETASFGKLNDELGELRVYKIK